MDSELLYIEDSKKFYLVGDYYHQENNLAMADYETEMVTSAIDLGLVYCKSEWVVTDPCLYLLIEIIGVKKDSFLDKKVNKKSNRIKRY